MKASEAAAVMTAWMSERFARTKDLKTPDHWLKPTSKPTPEEGAQGLRAMIARMAQKQAADGAPLPLIKGEG